MFCLSDPLKSKTAVSLLVLRFLWCNASNTHLTIHSLAILGLEHIKSLTQPLTFLGIAYCTYVCANLLNVAYQCFIPNATGIALVPRLECHPDIPPNYLTPKQS